MQQDTGDRPLTPKRKRILLIEDEPMARLQILQKLRDAGFEVDVAPNGLVALEKLRHGPPDAIFMDLLLPFVKGVDVIKEARRDPRFGQRPIYVCTSAALIHVWARRGTGAGATKVFDRAVTPLDALVAEVAGDLKVPASDLAENRERAPQPEAKASDPKARAPGQKPNPPSAPPPSGARSNTLMKRFMSAFKLGGTPESPPAEAAAAVLPRAKSVAGSNPAGGGPAAGANDADAQSSPDGTAPASAAMFDASWPAAFGGAAAVVTFDETGRIASTNEVCAAMFGWENGTLV